MNSNQQQLSENTSRKQCSDALWSQLQNAVALAAKQDQIVWTIFGVFWAANAVLLVALFTTGDLPKRPVGLVVSIAGLAISLVWTVIQKRAIAWLRFYETVMSDLEGTHLQVPVRLNNRRGEVGGMSVRRLMVGCSLTSVILWGCSVCWFFAHP
jgi:hypothetical protein